MTDGWQPQRGDLVWIYYFNAQNRYGAVTVSVAPRHFERTIDNYLGKPDSRWLLVVPHTHNSDYGVAHRPEGVFPTREKAMAALKSAVMTKINALEDALHATLKGGGMA